MPVIAGDAHGSRAVAAARPILARLAAPSAVTEALSACAEAFGNSAWPDVAWSFSNLSADGSPLLFTFSSGDDELRFSCEVAPPEIETSARVAAAAALAERLGATPVPARELLAWKTLQSRGRLRWGAWLGVCGGRDSTRVKVYVEVPREAVRSSAAPGAIALVGSSRLKIIGYDCATGEHEYYYRQPQMSEEELLAFLRFAGQAPSRRSAVEAFARLSDLPQRAALHWVNFGYSLGETQGGSLAFSMFVRARTLPSRSRIRERFLALERAAKSGRTAYAGLFETVPDECLPDHEIVSFIGRDAGPVEMRAGVSARALEAMPPA